MITISLCMIVKNEESVLDRCLASIADLMDEIVIVDTGSDDRTKEIAGRYTDRIYDFPWQDDFSAARNFSFSKASKDYIYAADADEVLDPENHKRFALLKQSLLSEIEIVQMKYITPDQYNTVINIRNEYRPKLYKRLREFCWCDPIHETVRIQPVVFDSEIEILHLPVSNHGKRDFGLFLRAFGQGQPISDKLHAMYAKELLIAGSEEDFVQAQPVFAKTLQQEDDRDTPSQDRIAQALCILSRCMRIQQNTAGFFKYALRAMAYHPCSEICCELGDYFSEIQDYEEAIRWYRCAAEETSAILHVRTGGDFPLGRLGDCYERLAAPDAGQAEEFKDLSRQYRQAALAWKMPEED